jgi:hypothetical protein
MYHCLPKTTLILFQLHDLLNKQIPDDEGEKADHDFDLIRHDSKCDYTGPFPRLF